MDHRPAILFLSQCLPYPPHSGVTNRTYHILSELRKEFDVSLVAFTRRNHQPSEAERVGARRALADLVSSVSEPVAIRSEWSSVARIWNHLRSLLTRRAYIYYEYGAADFKRQIETASRVAAPDLVHFDSLDLYRWTDVVSDVPRACTHHSIESDLLRLRALRTSSMVTRWYLGHQADLIRQVEVGQCRTFDLNVMMSDVDAERLRSVAPGAKTAVVPNGVDIDYFRPYASPTSVAGSIAFLGPTYMLPNRDAVDFFLTYAWPEVHRRLPNSTLHLVGKTPPCDRARFVTHPGVTCHGYVPDIRPIMAAAQCSIVPIRIGGGTRLKILDAWAMGKAVVSTAVGCEGLQAVDGENILVRDDPRDFAQAVVDVLSDPSLRQRLERGARATAEETYSWPIIGERLRACYRRLISERPATASGSGSHR